MISKLNNKAFSLVELIVTMLVTSIIMVAIVGLLSTALSAYRSTSDEAALQLEAQAGMNRISDLLIEADAGIGELIFYSNDNESGSTALSNPLGNGSESKVMQMKSTEKDSAGNKVDYWFLIIWNGGVNGENQIYIKKIAAYNGAVATILSTSDIQSAVVDVIANKEKYLLADYVSDFRIEKESTDSDKHKLLLIEMDLVKGNKSYSVKQYASLRNN